MRPHLCMLEFVVWTMQDIRYLCKAWDGLWTDANQADNLSAMVYVVVDDRRPGEEVNLRFFALEEILDGFLSSLEAAGLKFSREEGIPGMHKICRLEPRRGSLSVIAPNEANDPSQS